MTGIFIPGMSMPEHCGRCPLGILTHYGERECFINELNVGNYMDGWMGRMMLSLNGVRSGIRRTFNETS